MIFVVFVIVLSMLVCLHFRVSQIRFISLMFQDYKFAAGGVFLFKPLDLDIAGILNASVIQGSASVFLLCMGRYVFVYTWLDDKHHINSIYVFTMERSC